jgi:hypothetical protein
MSRKVATLVYSKQVGSMARKAVLAYFADRANDDGSGRLDRQAAHCRRDRVQQADGHHDG